MDKSEISEFIEKQIKDTNVFLVDVQINPGNNIKVFVDKQEGITIDECVRLSREFNSNFDRDKEDYDLQISSPGLDMPLKVEAQFQKYLGRRVEVQTNEGEKLKGELKEFDVKMLSLQVINKVKEAGSKKKKIVTEEKIIKRSDIKAVKAIISFK